MASSSPSSPPLSSQDIALNDNIDKMTLLQELLAKCTPEERSQVFKAVRTTSEEEEEEEEIEPEISYNRIFGKLNDGFPVGKDYLKKYHNTPRSGRNGLQQFHDLQNQVRQIFTNPIDVSVPSILSCNYKHNKQAKESCMKFIQDRIQSLGGLCIIDRDGEPHTFRWKEHDIYRYFILHKSYYQTIYSNRKEEKDLSLPSTIVVDDEPLPLALLEPLDEEDDVVKEPPKRKKKEKLVQKTKKKTKRTTQNNFDFWEDLTDVDKLTICHKLIGVDSRQKVAAHLKTWVQTRKSTGRSSPKISKNDSIEVIVHTVALWALQEGLIELTGEKGVAGYTIENWNRAL